jgi:thiosulfate/3-mercaptopyruvate sulfurtransferase
MNRYLIAAAAALALTTAATASFALELPGPLVQTDWLAKNLQDKNIVVLDMRADTKSFTAKAAGAPNIPGMNPCGAKKSKAETAGHIPRARLWDWKTVRAKRMIDGMELDGMVPARDKFEAMMREHGVNNDSVVVITADAAETSTFTFATRAYWTLKYYGHDRIAVLDGGTVKWKAENRPLSSDTTTPAAGNFSARTERREMLATTADVEAAVKNKTAQLLDGRTANYYLGQEKKDYVYAKGHIPGAKNLAHTQLVDEKTHALKSTADLKKLVSGAGIDPSKPTITFCDSGHLSSGQWFVLSELMGNKNARLYDGSMHE